MWQLVGVGVHRGGACLGLVDLCGARACGFGGGPGSQQRQVVRGSSCRGLSSRGSPSTPSTHFSLRTSPRGRGPALFAGPRPGPQAVETLADSCSRSSSGSSRATGSELCPRPSASHISASRARHSGGAYARTRRRPTSCRFCRQRQVWDQLLHVMRAPTAVRLGCYSYATAASVLAVLEHPHNVIEYRRPDPLRLIHPICPHRHCHLFVARQASERRPALFCHVPAVGGPCLTALRRCRRNHPATPRFRADASGSLRGPHTSQPCAGSRPGRRSHEFRRTRAMCADATPRAGPKPTVGTTASGIAASAQHSLWHQNLGGSTTLPPPAATTALRALVLQRHMLDM
jgi:hypothetical protein